MASSMRRRAESKTNKSKLLEEPKIRAKKLLCLPSVVSSFYVLLLIATIIVLLIVNAIMLFALRDLSGKFGTKYLVIPPPKQTTKITNLS